MTTFETLAKEVCDRKVVDEGIAVNLAKIHTSVCNFLNAHPNLHGYFIAQLEGLLLRTNTKRYERCILSMLLGALNDPEAVRSAVEMSAEIEKSAGRREAT